MSRPGKLIKEWTINRVELESNKDEAKAEEIRNIRKVNSNLFF